MRIGVFGGSFDPPHSGHAAVARLARSFLKLDKLIWVPTYNPPHKDSPATPYAHRLGLAWAAAEAPAETVSDIEAALPQPSFMLYTLQALKKLEGAGHDWFLILGSDSWDSFRSWHQPAAVLAEATPAIYPRKDFPVRGLGGKAMAMPAVEVPGESRKSRASFRENPEVALADLPSRVAAYIRRHGLYGVTKA